MVDRNGLIFPRMLLSRWYSLCVLVTVFSSVQRIVSAQGGQLKLLPAVNNRYEPAGTSTIMSCQPGDDRHNLYTEFKWFGPHGEITSDRNGLKILDDSASYSYNLLFENPTVALTGNYTCKAKFSDTDDVSVSAFITFYVDITFDERCVKKQYLVLNKEGVINCQVTASPVPQVSWTKNDRPIENHKLISEGLKVQKASRLDEGIYVVTAKVIRTGKFQQRRINVTIYTEPVMKTAKTEAELIEKERGTLRCEAEGTPQPLIFWFDPQNRNLSTVLGYVVNPISGDLFVTSVRREDKGNYRCVAKNDAGEASHEIQVSIIVKPEIKEFRNQTGKTGQSVTLECRASGEPRPNMTIRKEGESHPFSSDENGITKLAVQVLADETVLTLEINPVSRKYDGLYFCAAENKAAKVQKVGHLTVEFPPDLSAEHNPVKVWEGKEAKLVCISEAIPNATVEWLRHNREINGRQNDVFSINNTREGSVLKVPFGDTHLGDYVCKATNSLGSSNLTIKLERAAVPDSIMQPDVRELSPTTITFDIRPPENDGGMPIRAYLVRYTKTRTGETKEFEWKDVLGGPVTLEDLEPNTAYNFQFAARNDVGQGVLGGDVSRTTPAPRAPENPSILFASNISVYPTKFEIKWTMPTNNGKEIDHFLVTYVRVERMNGKWHHEASGVKEITVKDWKQTINPSVKLTDLTPNSFYSVEVKAHNEMGYGNASQLIFRTAEGSPDDNGPTQKSTLSLSMAGIVAIVVVLVLVILLVLDIFCYFRSQWGLLFFLRHTLCARSIDKAKEAAAEDGKTSKEPLRTIDETGEKPKDASEDTPMIDTSGDGKIGGNVDADKNRSPKGSKSSIAKDSMV